MVSIANPISDTLRHQLENMLKKSVADTFGAWGLTPVLETDVDRRECRDAIIGVISLRGDMTWTIQMGFPRSTAPGMALRFAGFEIDFDSPDMSDALGELTNVFAGDVNAKLDVLDIQTDISLPAAVYGAGIEAPVQATRQSLQMYYSSDAGPFWIKLAPIQSDG